MRELRRRDIIIGASLVGVTSIAGCIDAISGRGSAGDEGEVDYTVQPVQAAKDLAIELSAEITSARINDPDGPLTVEVTVENTADETVRFGERRVAQFMQRRSESPENAYVLMPTAWYGADAEGDKYAFEDGTWVRRQTILQTGDYQTVELQPEEAVTAELFLLVDAIGQEQEDNVAPDTYPDEIEFDAKVATSHDESGPMEHQTTWGLQFLKE